MFGNPDAPVTVLWFADLESPFTRKAFDIAKRVAETYPAKVRVVLENSPILDLHPSGAFAHEALAAAAGQGHEREMLELMVAHQGSGSRADFVSYAESIGLDVNRFSSELDTHHYQPEITRDLAEAKRRGVRGTPVFFANSSRIDGLASLEIFQKEIERQLGAVSRNSLAAETVYDH